jgi:hypothetical protein
MNKVLPLILVAACVSPLPPPPPRMADPAEIEAQQREATARSMGYPTRKTAQDLEALAHQQTREFKLAKKLGDQRLESLALAIEGVRGTCYTLVMRLGEGAAWGRGAEAGLRFDYRSPGGNGSGGPGVAGPGAVVSVGCAEATGTIQLSAAPMIGHDAIGQGPIAIELWTHVLTKEEAAHLEADKRQQEEEAKQFAAQEKAKKDARVSGGCAKCEARYQGCLGAGGSNNQCAAAFRSCAFEAVGTDYVDSCPSP